MNFVNSLLLCSFILFCISFASLFRCFLFSRVLCFCHFAFAFLFSLIFSNISYGIVFVCLLVGSGVVVVFAASWIVPVNVATACSMCSGVFNRMLQFILLSNIISYFFQSLPFGGLDCYQVLVCFCIQLLWVYDRS